MVNMISSISSYHQSSYYRLLQKKQSSLLNLSLFHTTTSSSKLIRRNFFNQHQCRRRSSSRSSSSSTICAVTTNNNINYNYNNTTITTTTRSTCYDMKNLSSIITDNNNNNNIKTINTCRRYFSEWTKGQDFTADSLTFNSKVGGKQRIPKIILDSYTPTGFDVANMIKRIDKTEEQLRSIKSSVPNMVHMDGSIIAFPHSAFLWKNIKQSSDVTLDSLSPILLYRPSIDYLFIGCNVPMPREQYTQIKAEMKSTYNIVVEQLDVANAMGTFNILNGEDRSVAVALVVDKEEINNDE